MEHTKNYLKKLNLARPLPLTSRKGKRMKTKTVLLTAAVVATGIGLLGLAGKKVSLPKKGTVKK